MAAAVPRAGARPLEVPRALQEGDKFVRWDEDSGVGCPVTLRVDPNGFYLYWTDQNNEVDMIDLVTVRDTRNGKNAKIPKDPKLRQVVCMGSQEPLEDKTLTVCYGSDFVNPNFVNFCCSNKETAEMWANEVVRLAYNLVQLNGPTSMFLLKAHTKLTLMADKAGKILVKNILKTFAQNKEDRKRVEKALEASGLLSGKNDIVSVSKFQYEDFFTLYKNLTQRTELEPIFDSLCCGSKRKLMTAEQFVEFLNKSQRDPRLNEILYPYANVERAKDLINQHEPNKSNAQRGRIAWKSSACCF